jgi:predicted nucleic acid-binding protein
VTRIFVSDTSVLIELARGGLLEHAFRLPYEFIVPDLLYRRELAAHEGPALLALGLKVHELEDTGVEQAQAFSARAPVSLPDAFALVLAKKNAEALLTGDQNLRKLAEAESVLCRGVLWVLDQMLLEQVADAAMLFNGLTAIANHPRCRLPKAEIRSRRQGWANQAGLPCPD